MLYEGIEAAPKVIDDIIEDLQSLKEQMEQQKPTRPAILDEEWLQNDLGTVLNSDGVAIAFRDYRKQIAALPDALRALKAVRESMASDSRDGFYYISKQTMGKLNAALGIE
jgi:hypothetical protein